MPRSWTLPSPSHYAAEHLNADAKPLRNVNVKRANEARKYALAISFKHAVGIRAIVEDEGEAEASAVDSGLIKETEKNVSAARQGPQCEVVPLTSIGGERRSYRGVVQSFAPHSHGYYVFGCVREGERTLQMNGHEYHIGPGDMLVFNPGDVHGCEQVSEELFAYDSVTVSAKLLDSASLRIPLTALAQARAVFGALMTAQDGEDVLEHVFFFASLLETRNRKAVDSHLHEEAAMRVYAHLRGHLAEPTSIAQLAIQEGLSEYTLIRAYRKRFAITPLQHLMSLRMECARDLLARGATPATVAAETGFADQAHLTRVFKQRIGTTPAAYRKMVAR